MPYVGNIENLKWIYDEEEALKKGSPICINTPNIEVRIIVLQPASTLPTTRITKRWTRATSSITGAG